MKKKIKLFSTIASLCLAVALMAFGVWAATASVHFATNSTIQFTASTEVFGKFEAKVANKDATAVDTIAAERKNVNGGAWALVDSAEGETRTVDVLMGAGVTLGKDLKLAATGDKYTFTYKFTNTSPYDIQFKVVTTGLTTSIKQSNNNAENAIVVTDVVESDKTGTLLKGTGTKTWTITVELRSLDLAENATINVPFSVELAKSFK